MTNPTDVLAVERLLTDFASFADRGDCAALGELFLEGAILTVGGHDLHGPTQIADDCRRRFTDPHRRTRHLWTNLHVERADEAFIAATALQLTFEQSTPGLPVQLRVNDLYDEFRKDTRGHWRFARRRIERAMALALPLYVTPK